MTIPLNQLRKKNIPWNWSSEQQNAFDTINEAIKNFKLLHHPQQDMPFIVHCDASNVAIGSALLQKQNEQIVPIEFISKQLKKHQLNWHISEQELYAVVYAINYWRQYLLLRSFTIYTDHKNLEYLFKIGRASCRKECRFRWSI